MELDPRGAARVLSDLAALEADLGLPRVEAHEARRLAARARGADEPADVAASWRPRTVDGWYLGIRDGAAGGSGVGAAGAVGAVGEAGRLGEGPVTAALDAAEVAGVGRVWLRGADPADVAAAEAAGWRVRRELLVLGRGRGAAPPEVGPPPAGLRRVPLVATDPSAVARLLDRAYAGPRRDGLVEADGGPWTSERFTRTAAVALADPDDLVLVADGEGALVGAHWTGRRGDGVGEVFNLAVDPAWGGRGLGAWLLGAGLDHLADLGRDEVLLWVDRANAPARALYARAGFAERGRDVALER